MSRLSEQQVDLIAARLAERLRLGAVPGRGPVAPGSPPGEAPAGGYVVNPMRAPGPAARPGDRSGEGVFATVDDCVEAAAVAFRRLNQSTLALRSRVIAAIREAMRRDGEELARLAWQETGLGRCRGQGGQEPPGDREDPGHRGAAPGDHHRRQRPHPDGVGTVRGDRRDHSDHQPDQHDHLQYHRHGRRRQQRGLQRAPRRGGVLDGRGALDQPRDRRRRAVRRTWSPRWRARPSSRPPS